MSGDRKYVRRFDDHYFMTPPSQFIYDHFPEDARWQLLDEPVSKQEYENLVYLESEFFNLGLKLGQKNGTIGADKQINVSIYAPEDVLMMAKLEYADRGWRSCWMATHFARERESGMIFMHSFLPQEAIF